MDRTLKYALVNMGLFVVLFMVLKCVVDGVGAALGMWNIIGVVVMGLIDFAVMFLLGAKPRK